ncbi:protein FAR1-RELATED SEQUENCE 2-like isoform X2 [Humulus lupulus]|uniref:protein FAR1-RELATED SEQUENCE 2-like isoform X2 n=1 Tax=Humulus lupulus TaxID=3486 RepID=UPI002B4048DE|nr:protein FAR1-RELATED SEQUENCE 2-like isoform X2 [Humulus lupulus]
MTFSVEQDSSFFPMEIDLELPSCEQDKLDIGSNSRADVVDNTVGIDIEEEPVDSPGFSECDEEDHESNADQNISSYQDPVDFNTVGVDVVNKGSTCEPCNGLEFESKEEAYSFYREYARFVGFGITIKASRRSKKSGKFIDIKVACSRFGNKRESGTSVNPRPCIKTDCKAGMHIKRKGDGKWIIHSFMKEHNHEIYPDDFYYAINRKSKQSIVAAYQKKGLQLALEDEDIQLMLDFFMHKQEESHDFFYSIDLDHEKRLKSVLWVDAKGRNEYSSFCDVVFFDTFYVANKYKIPFVPIVGVNHHCQYFLLGCALIGEETTPAFVWLMRTWLKAVGGLAPRVIISDQDNFLKEAAADVFPDARHCFCLWHVLGRIPGNLSCEMNQKEKFIENFHECIHRSWTDEQFEMKWWKMVERFDLREDVWIQSLYEDRKSWVPTYMKDLFLAGMSTNVRSESLCSFFDGYLSPVTTVKELIELYKKILEDIYVMEANADFETQHKQRTLRSLSNFEKQTSLTYTDAIFKKFQLEVLGVVSCHLQKEGETEAAIIYQVDDSKERQNFLVAWNEEEFQISCLCRSFEYKGFLCRHALLVLQMSEVSVIPSHYILKRWTKDAKVKHTVSELPRRNLRLQRFNDLCKLATKLGEEGSLSSEAYHIAIQALEEVLKHCVDVNSSVQSSLGPSMSNVHSFVDAVENHGSITGKSFKKKKMYKKRKGESESGVTTRMQDSDPRMEHMRPRADNLDNCYIPQQEIQVVELDSGAQDVDGFYNRHSIHGVGQFESISTVHDGFYTHQQGLLGQLHSVPTRAVHYGNQQCMQGLLGFRVPTVHGCFDIQENLQDVEQSVGSSQYQNIAPKHQPDKHLSR